MYSPELLNHFEYPRNAGELTNANAQVRIENPACGDILELAARLEGDRLALIRFRAKGCVPAMGCASAMTELAAGKTLTEAANITREDIVRAVGSLPPASGHAAQLAIDALQAILQQWKRS
jgi:nitrogen fixation NifU-like protein